MQTTFFSCPVSTGKMWGFAFHDRHDETTNHCENGGAVKPQVSHEDDPDALLLKSIQQGDERAFAVFYDHMASTAFGLLCKILNDAKEAEDVLQEGFMHIWHKAATYDPRRSSPSTWAFMIFRHKAIDHLRSKMRENRRVERLAHEMGPESTVDDFSSERVDLGENRKEINTALEQIPPDQREAIQLAFFSGLTQTEIASRLSAPLGTVKARIRRGLLKLGELLSQRL